MHVLKSKKSRVIVATAAVFVLGGTAAFAYWTSTGSGSGAGTTGTSTAFTVTGVAVTAGLPLTPGTAQTVGFTVNNPGTGNQILSSVVATVATSAGEEWTAVSGCSALDYTVSAPVITYGQIAGSSSVSGTVLVTMNNLGTSQDACKGVAYPLYFAAS